MLDLELVSKQIFLIQHIDERLAPRPDQLTQYCSQLLQRRHIKLLSRLRRHNLKPSSVEGRGGKYRHTLGDLGIVLCSADCEGGWPVGVDVSRE